MSDEAEVVFERQPFDQDMVNTMQHLKSSRAHSHGNYLPALDKAIEVLEADAFSGAQLFLVFLSDGAPSDHCQMCCQHGVQVWQDDCDSERRKNGRFPFLVCEDPRTAQMCRGEVRASVKDKCLDRISRLGDLFGRDRTYVGTVAFGPESEDYQVLKDMAAKLPRGTFQRLGLSAMSLKTAFSSLTSDLTTLNTQMSGKSLTVRNVKQQQAGTQVGDLEWDIYKTTDRKWTLDEKLRWDTNSHKWVRCPLLLGVIGVAKSKMFLAKGAERYVYQCYEVNASSQQVGRNLIAKETLHEEYLSHDFHKRFCRMQSEAEELAVVFNTRLQGRSEWQIHFLQCVMYQVKDPWYEGGMGWILAESQLDGVFTKWNNNGGSVRDVMPTPTQGASAGIGAIMEENEDEDEDKDEDDQEDPILLLNQVPQCFSHFTHSHTRGKKLVCDVQGVWNKVDGFTLTDPVFHSTEHKHKNGATDKGSNGILKFFETHKCGSLCRRLGLKEMKA
jgi:hypothetical protein